MLRLLIAGSQTTAIGREALGVGMAQDLRCRCSFPLRLPLLRQLLCLGDLGRSHLIGEQIKN